MINNKGIEDITPEFASNILSRLTFHFIQPKEQKKRSQEDTDTILAGLNKSIMLIEKQISKKVITNIQDEDIRVGSIVFKAGTKTYSCPSCKKHITRSCYSCPNCGQAIDWSEDESK